MARGLQTVHGGSASDAVRWGGGGEGGQTSPTAAGGGRGRAVELGSFILGPFSVGDSRSRRLRGVTAEISGAIMAISASDTEEGRIKRVAERARGRRRPRRVVELPALLRALWTSVPSVEGRITFQDIRLVHPSATACPSPSTLDAPSPLTAKKGVRPHPPAARRRRDRCRLSVARRPRPSRPHRPTR